MEKYTESMFFNIEEIELLEEALNLWKCQWEESELLKNILEKIDRSKCQLQLRTLARDSDLV